MQWRMVGRRCPSGSMTLVGDFGQSSRPGALHDWDAVRAQLPGDEPARVVTLSVNYRTPAEIMTLADRFVAAAAPDIRPARSVRSTGRPPQFLAADDSADLLTVVADATQNGKSEGGTTAVIAPRDLHEDLVALLADLGAVGGSADAIDAPVTVVDASDAKGLEFDHVIVVEPSRLVAPDASGLRLLYTALTRATQNLTVVHGAAARRPSSPPPPHRLTAGRRKEYLMATTTDTDLTAADVAWDLEPLVDGEGEAGVDELLDEADHVAASVAERRGTVARLDAAGLASVMRELASIAELVGRAASYASLRFASTPPTWGAGVVHIAEERATAVNTKVLFFELEWAALPDDRAAELLVDEQLTFCRHYPRRCHRPHLLTEPEEPRDDGEGGHGRSVEPAVQRADVDDRRRSRRWTGQPRRGAVPVELARPGRASNRGRRGDRRARAGPADAGLRVQHVAGRQGRRRPLAQVPALARQHEPRQRGQRRVGASTRRGCAGPVRHTPALVCAQGSGARARPASPTTTAWRRWRTRSPSSMARGAARAGRHGCPPPSSRARRSDSSTRRGSTPPSDPASARAPSAYGAVAAPVPALNWTGCRRDV